MSAAGRKVFWGAALQEFPGDTKVCRRDFAEELANRLVGERPPKDYRDLDPESAGRMLSKMLMHTPEGKRRFRRDHERARVTAAAAAKESTKMGMDVATLLLSPGSRENDRINEFLCSGDARDPYAAITAPKNGIPVSVLLLLASPHSALKGYQALDTAGIVDRINEVRKRLAVSFGKAICGAVGALHHLDTSAVSAFAIAWITLQLGDAKINGVLRAVDCDVTQIRKVSTEVDLLAPGVLQALGAGMEK